MCNGSRTAGLINRTSRRSHGPIMVHARSFIRRSLAIYFYLHSTYLYLLYNHLGPTMRPSTLPIYGLRRTTHTTKSRPADAWFFPHGSFSQITRWSRSPWFLDQRSIKPGGSQRTCVTRNSWKSKPRGVKTTESEFSDPITLPQQILYSYT
jgi:hypothetical protein